MFLAISITVFTPTQDNSNLRRLLHKTRLPRKNLFIQMKDYPTKIKCLLKEWYFTIDFIHLIQKACQILPTFTSRCITVSIFTVSAFDLLNHTPNIHITLFTAIPQHIISPIHCIGYRHTALLWASHSHPRWDALPCCYDPHWLINTCIFLGL